jgi:hypothetical protein
MAKKFMPRQSGASSSDADVVVGGSGPRKEAMVIEFLPDAGILGNAHCEVQQRCLAVPLDEASRQCNNCRALRGPPRQGCCEDAK